MLRKILSLILVLTSFTTIAQSTADSLLDFIHNNPNRSSFYLLNNDTLVARLNENKQMPLASTVKIIIAIEFAKQAAAGIIDEKSRIPLSAPGKYYIPNTDGDAHPNWLQYEMDNGHISNDSVSLLDIARGMILFSSNANTEYLLDLLGIDDVNSNIEMLNLVPHTAVFPMVSSLFIYQNPLNNKESDVLKGISKLDEEAYCKVSFGIHFHLKNDSSFLHRFRPQDLTMKMQKAWSDRLPASSTKAYAMLCSLLNNRKIFDENTYGVLAEVLESIMENPANQQWLKHAGMKGGSTSWVLTKAIYATTQKDERFSLAYFFNNLKPEENSKLQGWMNSFELAILKDPTFVQKIKQTIK